MSKKSQKRSDLEKKLTAYSTAAGVAIALSQSADADIIWSGVQNLTATFGSPLQIDLDGDTVLDFEFGMSLGMAYGLPSTQMWNSAYLRPLGGNLFASSTSVRRFLPGDTSQTIGPGNTFTNGAGSGYLAWRQVTSTMMVIPPYTTTYGSIIPGTTYPSYVGMTGGGSWEGQRGCVGVQFDIGGSTHYGWIDASVDFGITQTTIHGWGYEDTAGASIDAGAVPEPGSLALLALGAAGLYASRKGRKEADEV